MSKQFKRKKRTLGKHSVSEAALAYAPALKENFFNINTIDYGWNDDARYIQLVKLIREGIDYKTFEVIASDLPLKDRDWASVLDTTVRTILRYKKENKSFAPNQTEKIIEIQQLVNYGKEVFGSTESFNSWLQFKNLALGGVKPIELLDTSIGLGILKDSLGRIEHGVLA